MEESGAGYPMMITSSAVKKIKALIKDEGNPNLCLRVYITGGGCSGFSYGFSFDEAPKEGDTIIEKEDGKMIIDSLSIQYLAGSEVNYVEGLQGSRFTVDNPNAVTTCGCGSSFSV